MVLIGVSIAGLLYISIHVMMCQIGISSLGIDESCGNTRYDFPRWVIGICIQWCGLLVSLRYAHSVQVICTFLGMGVAPSAGNMSSLDISRSFCSGAWLVAKFHACNNLWSFGRGSCG